jgi:hypothetical protein
MFSLVMATTPPPHIHSHQSTEATTGMGLIPPNTPKKKQPVVSRLHAECESSRRKLNFGAGGGAGGGDGVGGGDPQGGGKVSSKPKSSMLKMKFFDR